MGYKETVTADFNRALIRKLRKENRVATKSETKLQTTNAELTNKRRLNEARAQAKELGIPLEELLK